MAINPLQPPINYSAQMVDLGPAFANAGQAFQSLGQSYQEQAQREQAALAKQQFATDLSTAQTQGTQGAWLNMVAKYPQFREAFGDVGKGVEQKRVDTEFTQGFEISNALENNAPQVAIDRVQTIIAAKKNSGEPTKIYDDVLASLQSGNIKGAQNGVNFALLAINPKRFEESVKAKSAGAEAPFKLTETEAKSKEAVSSAQKAAVAAKFAESNAALDLQKKGWDITKIQEDIKIAKQNSQIAALNSQIAREGNQVKREENNLKLQDMVQKRDSAVREKVSEVENARSTMDNMLNTADRILKTPKSVIGSAAGPISSRMPTLTQDTADLEALVETLGAQSFIAQIPNIKGMGALSNAEGEKLQAALQNFSLKQSPERLIENVKEAQRLILKGRSNLSKRSGLPDSVPDTPAVQTPSSDIDALVKKYTGGR